MSFYAFENDQEFRDEVKRRLGHPMVKVELDDSHFKDIIKNTKRWFMAKKSCIAYQRKIWTGAEIEGWEFDEIDSVNGVYKVLNVFSVPDSGSSSGTSEDCTYFEILPYGFPLWGGSSNLTGQGNGFGRTSYIFQVYQQLEQRKKTYGTDHDWFVHYDHVNGDRLYLTPPEVSREALVFYKPATLPISALKGRDAQLFFDWGVADAKEILGIIRSKYKDYPAAGGTISTDGSELLDAAKTRKEELEEEIAGSQGPMMPFTF